ncbi:MAG: hypothetical protein ACW980_25335 [Promethearchaeota archaeon]|jgi:hypothetical protein
MSQELDRLKQQKMILMAKNMEQENFINDVFAAVMPLTNKIDSTGGLFKIFKIVKLAIELVKIIINLFKKKPEPFDWNNF